MKGWVIATVIIVAAAALTGIIIFGVVPSVKRRKLAQAWADYAQKAKINLTTDYIQNELKKVSNSEVDTLITFSEDIRDNKTGQWITMLPEVDKILAKTNLGKIETYLAALIGKPKQ